LTCAICEERKEKRFCPAVHGKICPQCCGEQREVTLDCPSDCPYLQQAREHANAHTELSSNRDLETWFSELEIPPLEVPEQFLYEREELILGLSFALAKGARDEPDRSLVDRSLVDRSLMDRDLIAALGALDQDLPHDGEFRPDLRTADRQSGAPGRRSKCRSRGRNHGQGIPPSGTTTHRPYPPRRFRCAEGSGVSSAFGTGTHIGEAKIAGVRRFPSGTISRKALLPHRPGRASQPDCDSLEEVRRPGGRQPSFP
jgi:hypothetical protein